MKYLFSLFIAMASISVHASSLNCSNLFFEEMPYAYMEYDTTESAGIITLKDMNVEPPKINKKMIRSTTPVRMRLNQISNSYESSTVQILLLKDKDSGLNTLELSGPRNQVLDLLIEIEIAEGVSNTNLKTYVQKFLDVYPLLKNANETELPVATQILAGF